MPPCFLRVFVAVAVAVAVGVLSAVPAAAATVRDDAGFEVQLERPARRIVSLAPHTTELLYEIGAGDTVVGAEPYSDYPDAAKTIPRVGGLSGIDVEAIVALKPDLVIAWLSGTSKAQIELLVRLKIPVFRSEPHDFDDVTSTLTRFGALTGHDAQAQADATRFRTRLAALRDTYAHRAPVRVFYQVWNKPLMTVEDWMPLLRDHNPGDKVTITFKRDGKEMTTEAVLQGRAAGPHRIPNADRWSKLATVY